MPGQDFASELTPHLEAAIERAVQKLMDDGGGPGLLDSLPDDRRWLQEMVWRLASTRVVLRGVLDGSPPLDDVLVPFRPQLIELLESRIAELQDAFPRAEGGHSPDVLTN